MQKKNFQYGSSSVLRMLRVLAVPGLIGAILTSAVSPVASTARDRSEAPRLVVLLVVDQLSADLFERYQDLFEGGFRRLLTEGRVYPNAVYDHAITETSPGHATMATGVHPFRHGIVANAWWERDGEGAWTVIKNVEDVDAPLIEFPGYMGSSPRALLRTGLADWIHENEEDAKIVSVSAKDRAAILMASQHKGHVYWFDALSGRFVTSVYYRDRYPGWVTRFNDRVVGEFDDSIWVNETPWDALPLTRGDTASYEGDGVNTAFPHRFGEGGEDPPLGYGEWLSTTPMLDGLVLQFAREAILQEDMGDDEKTDYLAISLSQTDKVGHAFGPYSREQLDNLLKLDRVLGQFFEFLDSELGRDSYTVAFTSDHGASEIPEARAERGEDGVRLTQADGTELVTLFTKTVREYASQGPDAVAGELSRAAVQLPWISRAWTHEELLGETPGDSIALFVRRSLLPTRPAGRLSRFGVESINPPHYIGWEYERGTTHFTPYLYDRRVPFILMGVGIEAGRDERRVSPIDLAPTLADFAGAPVPDDLDGVSRKPR